MIKILLKTRDKAIIGFESSGHANFAEQGEDIICAAVSALTINSINTLEEVLNLDKEIRYTYGENEITLDIKPELLDEARLHDTQVVLRSYELGIISIIKEYEHSKEFEDFISLNYREV